MIHPIVIFITRVAHSLEEINVSQGGIACEYKGVRYNPNGECLYCFDANVDKNFIFVFN